MQKILIFSLFLKLLPRYYASHLSISIPLPKGKLFPASKIRFPLNRIYFLMGNSKSHDFCSLLSPLNTEEWKVLE